MNLTLLLTIPWLIMLLTGCNIDLAATTIVTTPTSPALSGTEEVAITPGGISQLEAVDEIVAAVNQRTPVPSPTPGPIEQKIIDYADQSSLSDQQFLGISTADWINLAVSVLFAPLVIWFVAFLLFRLVRRAVRRSKTQFDDYYLDTNEREIKWFVTIIIIRFAILRLDIWGDGIRTILEDTFFLLGLFLLYIISLRTVAFAARWYRGTHVTTEKRKEMAPIIEVLTRMGYLLVSIIAISSALSHFGINVTMFSAVILFGGLIVIIAARAAIADAISGFLIMIDKPFRVGDEIYVKELNTWGEVVDIGIRITRIRPPDNREVIIPNSLVGASQVINYTYPDPSFRIMTDIRVAYGTDTDQLQKVIEDAVRGVEGVLPDKSVQVLFQAFGDSAREVRVHWWIEDVIHQDQVLNLVNVAIERALNEAGIEMPIPKYDLNLRNEDT
jgi:small-conductance mechanosensitive channel